MDFKCGVLVIITAQICTTLALPPCTCTRNLNPVCGSDGVDYSNPCRLECAAYTLGTNITVAKLGPCNGFLPEVVVIEPPPCPPCKPCPLVYRPVCGSDGKQYSNECELNYKKSQSDPSLKVEHSGPCKIPEGNVLVCATIFMPVCGSDGKTYSNSCQLNAATQKNPGLSVSHNGPCETSVKVEDRSGNIVLLVAEWLCLVIFSEITH